MKHSLTGLLFALCLIAVSPAHAAGHLPLLSGVHAQTSTIPFIAMPPMSKDQEKRFDKGEKKTYERCAAPPKNTAEAGNACAAIAPVLQNKLGDPAAAAAAQQRACLFGNTGGCVDYGKALAAAGDVAGSRDVWSKGPCADANPCRAQLFYSYATTEPTDRAQAETLGMPMCNEGNDDNACQTLAQIGVPIDFAAVKEARRQKRIAELNSAIGSSDSQIPLLQANLALAQSNAASATGWAALLSKGTVVAASLMLSNEQKNNAKLHAQLDACMAGQDCFPGGVPPNPPQQVASH